MRSLVRSTRTTQRFFRGHSSRITFPPPQQNLWVTVPVRTGLCPSAFYGCKFSIRGSKFSTRGCKFSTCTCLRQDEILSPQREVGRGTLICGSKFSTCCFDKRHDGDRVATKRYRHLILSRFRTGGNDLTGRRRGIQRQGHFASLTDDERTRLEEAVRQGFGDLDDAGDE